MTRLQFSVPECDQLPICFLQRKTSRSDRGLPVGIQATWMQLGGDDNDDDVDNDGDNDDKDARNYDGDDLL